MNKVNLLEEFLENIQISDDDESIQSEYELGSLEDEKNGQYQTILKSLFSLFLRHKWTLKGLEDTSKFVNTITDANIKLPTTKCKLIQEYFRNSNISAYQHLYCEECNIYSKCAFSNTRRINCENCNIKVKKDSFFVTISVEDQIAIIIDKYFDQIIQYRETVLKETNVTDIYNANHLRSMLTEDENIWSLSFNTDGVSITKSNKSSLWPVLLTCNFLPPQLRYKDQNIIVAALYHGNEKPNIHDFLRPLSEHFVQLSSIGVFVRNQFFKIFITNALLDLPAKSMISQMKQFNSCYACNFCLQKGDRVRRGIRYPYEWPLKLRTHYSMLQNINKVNRIPNRSFSGVKGISPMVSFECFDLAISFPIDYMHCVLLGITKNLLQFWTETKNNKKPFYIVKAKRDILDQRLLQIKPPTYISRPPRSLQYVKYFKASEYRSFLLFYLPVCFKNLLPSKYIHHARVLSSSIYKLLSPIITENDLKEVKEKLNEFVRDYEDYYGKENMTMNVHSLLHLVDCVKNFGPLFCYSMFPFESYNGLLKRFVVAPTDVLYQIATRYIVYKMVQTDEINEQSAVLRNETNVTFENDHLRAFEEADVQPIMCYACFNRNGVKFTSKVYTKAKKTTNYFVITESGIIGSVQFYFTCGSKSYAMIQNMIIYKTVDQIRKVNFTNEYQVIQTEEIKDRCIYIQMLKKDYIVYRPNSVERN